MATILKRKPLATRLKAGLAEAVGYAKGELTLRTTEAPSPPPKIAPKDVVSLRAKIGISQSVFARVLNVSTKTVQSWEQGERRPSRAALRMLQVFREIPQFVIKVLGARTGHGARGPRSVAACASSR